MYNVIYVTVAYRLGALGYLAEPYVSLIVQEEKEQLNTLLNDRQLVFQTALRY